MARPGVGVTNVQTNGKGNGAHLRRIASKENTPINHTPLMDSIERGGDNSYYSQLTAAGSPSSSSSSSSSNLKNDSSSNSPYSSSSSLGAGSGSGAGGGGEQPAAAMSMEDKMSMVLLFILYALQGIPMGLCGSIPLYLKERGTTYEGLSLFSLVSLPFSLKLVWAPLVDSCYLKDVGRRKTWLIPIQLLTGVVMLVGAPFVGHWLGGDVLTTTPTPPNVNYLTAFFLALYFLMATQDIAVDGWALTMLSRENVAYASTCNSIGQSFGFFLANQGFTALSDSTWCHRHFNTPPGTALVTLSSFMRYSGWVFLVVTVFVWIFKTERPIAPEDEPEGLIDTYRHVAGMFRLRSVQMLFLILLTCKIPFAPADAVSTFKLQEYGMPKADIATISPILLIIGLLLPAVTSSWLTTRPLDVFMIGIPLKLITSALGWVVVQTTTSAYQTGEAGIFFFLSLLVVMILHEVAGQLIFISSMSFFAKISDPNIGGTYMTFLNTVSNLGSKWPNSCALWFQPKLTVATCKFVAIGVGGTTSFAQDVMSSCAADGGTACVAAGGKCQVLLDGYTVQTAACILFGVLWIYVFRAVINKVQDLPYGDWMVTASSRAASAKGL